MRVSSETARPARPVGSVVAVVVGLAWLAVKPSFDVEGDAVGIGQLRQLLERERKAESILQGEYDLDVSE